MEASVRKRVREEIREAEVKAKDIQTRWQMFLEQPGLTMEDFEREARSIQMDRVRECGMEVEKEREGEGEVVLPAEAIVGEADEHMGGEAEGERERDATPAVSLPMVTSQGGQT
ncbi:hypothetical protein KIPB_015142, partial [Kipferlia bialata]|eukprot:g15142.t1